MFLLELLNVFIFRIKLSTRVLLYINYFKCYLGHPAATIPPPTIVTPVLASSGYNSVPNAPTSILANPQEALKKAQEEAKVNKNNCQYLFLNFLYLKVELLILLKFCILD